MNGCVEKLDDSGMQTPSTSDMVWQAATLYLKKHKGKGSGDTAIPKHSFLPSSCRGKFKGHEYQRVR